MILSYSLRSPIVLQVTAVLRECLGSLSCQAALLAHVSPDPARYSETLHTLQLAGRVHRLRRRRARGGSGGAGRSRRSGRSSGSDLTSSSATGTGTSSSEMSCDTVRLRLRLRPVTRSLLGGVPRRLREQRDGRRGKRSPVRRYSRYVLV